MYLFHHEYLLSIYLLIILLPTFSSYDFLIIIIIMLLVLNLFPDTISPHICHLPSLTPLLSSHFSFCPVPSAFCCAIISPALHQSVQQ